MNYRKTGALLILIALGYYAWFSWQQSPRPPLQAKLFPFTATEVDRIDVSLQKEARFELSRAGSNWIAQRGSRYVEVDSGYPDLLIKSLLELRSSGLARPKAIRNRHLGRLTLRTGERNEQLDFLAVPDSLLPAVYLQLNGLPDVYLVENFDRQILQLQFDDFRNRRIVDLTIFDRLDSISWQTDSTRSILLERSSNRAATDSLFLHWSTWESNDYAERFDEIGQADRLIGHYRLYGSPTRDSITVSVYRDSNWQRPIVLASSQYPRDYWNLDSLPYPVEE